MPEGPQRTVLAKAFPSLQPPAHYTPKAWTRNSPAHRNPPPPHAIISHPPPDPHVQQDLKRIAGRIPLPPPPPLSRTRPPLRPLAQRSRPRSPPRSSPRRSLAHRPPPSPRNLSAHRQAPRRCPPLRL